MPVHFINSLSFIALLEIPVSNTIIKKERLPEYLQLGETNLEGMLLSIGDPEPIEGDILYWNESTA
jgi:hypothetical protein